MGLVTRVEQPPAVTEASVLASHLFSAEHTMSAMRQQKREEALTHLGIEEVLCCIVGAHVNGPCRDVSEQHRAEPSVQASKAILEPDDASGAGEAFVYGTVGAGVLSRAEGALGLQAGLDNVERAGHDAGGDAGRRSTQRIDGPVRQSGDADSEAGEGRAPIAGGLWGGHVAGLESNGGRRIPVLHWSRGRRRGIVRRHWGHCGHGAVRVGPSPGRGENAYRPSSPWACLSVRKPRSTRVTQWLAINRLH